MNYCDQLHFHMNFCRLAYRLAAMSIGRERLNFHLPGGYVDLKNIRFFIENVK